MDIIDKEANQAYIFKLAHFFNEHVAKKANFSLESKKETAKKLKPIKG